MWKRMLVAYGRLTAQRTENEDTKVLTLMYAELKTIDYT